MVTLKVPKQQNICNEQQLKYHSPPGAYSGSSAMYFVFVGSQSWSFQMDCNFLINPVK